MSVAEDERPHPKVGAVVVKDGKVLARLIVVRSQNLMLSMLRWKRSYRAKRYTTLEPCVKRNAPKICCAQRLIDRKVARVCIGMLDPNPDIRGLGDQLLSEAGIEIQLFPKDLRSQVEEMNRKFIRDQKEKWNARKSSAAG
jgi:pyrimidine deaminase RibD-like protein